MSVSCVKLFFQAEDGIRDLVRSRGLGDGYKRQGLVARDTAYFEGIAGQIAAVIERTRPDGVLCCLL